MAEPGVRPTLLPHHAKLITASGISEAVATARGYKSATTKAELARLGFGKSQQIIPSLLIPIFDMRGETALYQSRPDAPRRNTSGKPVKYETPTGAKMAIDVHPSIRERLSDPNVPLFITEGIRKADSAISHGLCCIALLGVWNWRGSNDQGGLTALADWEIIALNDRRVNLVFDSDVAVKQQVEMAMHRLKKFLEKRGASVRIIYLASASDGGKVGLDDYFACGGTVNALLASTHAPSRPASRYAVGDDSTLPYVIDQGHFCFEKSTRDGTVLVPLCNFTAAVQEELVLDDGQVQDRAFIVGGTLESGDDFPPARVPVDRFGAMHWVAPAWGLRAVINAGASTRDRVREAIQRFSPKATTRLIYTYTGWRQVGGHWIYLTSNGAVGDAQAEVDLPDELRSYRLPARPSDPKLAMRHSLDLLKVANLEVTAPFWCATFRAPLASVHPLDVSLWIEGFTGSMKSTLAALFLGHFGEFTRTTLPGAWSSTVNHLEHRAFILKDTIFVVDDYTPTVLDRREMETKAARLIRAQGNLAGRGRLKADLTEHRAFHPRGLVLVTGEERPAGQSVLARTFLVELERSQVNIPLLTESQTVVGVLPHAMSGYLRWLAPQMKTLPAQLRSEFREMRQRATQDGTHLRVPETVAHLALGLDCGLAFAQEIGACDAVEADELRMRCWESLMSRAKANASIVEANRPTRLFIEVFQTLLDQKKISVIPKTTISDERRDTFFVGWEDDDNYYLIPNAIYQAVARFCREAGESFPVGQTRLQQDLRREQLSQTETNRTTSTVWIAPVSRRVLCLRKSAISAVLGQAGPHSSPVLTGLAGNSEGGRDGV